MSGANEVVAIEGDNEKKTGVIVTFNDMERMADAFAKSGLFGAKTREQALALMLVAQAEGLHPAIAARDYHIINGRPAKTAEAMLRSFLNAGGRVEWHKLDDTGADATFSHPQGGTIRISWDAARAKTAGLLDKAGDMFRKYPRAMYRSRVVSEGVRTVCPAATSGMYVPEEVSFFEPRQEIKQANASVVEERKEERKTESAISTDNDGDYVDGVIENVEYKEGKTKSGGKWQRWGITINGVKYGSFNRDHGACAEAAYEAKSVVRVYWRARVDDRGRTFKDVVSITLPPKEEEDVGDFFNVEGGES